MSKILLLGSQHGDELLGERLYEYLRGNRVELMPHVEYMVGNPGAHRHGYDYIGFKADKHYKFKV